MNSNPPDSSRSNGEHYIPTIFECRQKFFEASKLNNIDACQEAIRFFREASKKPISQLKKVCLFHAKLGDLGVDAFLQSMKPVLEAQISEFSLNFCEVGSSGGSQVADLFSRSSMLNTLELFGNNLDDDCCVDFENMLKSCQAIKRLKLGDNKIGPLGISRLSAGLSVNTTLVQLHLGGNAVQQNGMEHLANAMISNQGCNIQSLSLRDAQLANGMHHLGRYLASPNCTLTDLQIKGNNIGSAGAITLASFLAVNTSLRVLELQTNNLGPEGATALSEALIQRLEKCSLAALNLNDNVIGDDGAVSVAKLLRDSRCAISAIGLAGNKIRKRGTVEIAECLAVNRSLMGLDLGDNEVSNSGALALSHVLSSLNRTLSSIDLRNCDIHLKGIEAMAAAVTANTCLKAVDLSYNSAKNAGAFAWARTLAHNTSLTRLSLTDNKILQQGGQALATAISTNDCLRIFSFGGQGQSANRIDPSLRKIIDLKIEANRNYWEAESRQQQSFQKSQVSPAATSPNHLQLTSPPVETNNPSPAASPAASPTPSSLHLSPVLVPRHYSNGKDPAQGLLANPGIRLDPPPPNAIEKWMEDEKKFSLTDRAATRSVLVEASAVKLDAELKCEKTNAGSAPSDADASDCPDACPECHEDSCDSSLAKNGIQVSLDVDRDELRKQYGTNDDACAANCSANGYCSSSSSSPSSGLSSQSVYCKNHPFFGETDFGSQVPSASTGINLQEQSNRLSMLLSQLKSETLFDTSHPLVLPFHS